jgi:Rieske Fe-S protein
MAELVGRVHDAGLIAELRRYTWRAQGDATYLVTKADGTLEPFGVNAVCTHLGCVVPWNKAANKFCCPCHGSQYDQNGKVRPASLYMRLSVLSTVFCTLALSGVSVVVERRR